MIAHGQAVAFGNFPEGKEPVECHNEKQRDPLAIRPCKEESEELALKSYWCFKAENIPKQSSSFSLLRLTTSEDAMAWLRVFEVEDLLISSCCMIVKYTLQTWLGPGGLEHVTFQLGKL
ncbi:hypothetical protein GH714_009275 [Hevea brasiliensis]|uniref:Uncharacterized protein n=1 Tax=Hevea brasiliensis TaxID=3981 RepID=A0A6A6LHY0_HEVBR|nr:hypothetical protein GH714_009275 [Hevea brasiliensis]